MSQGIILLVFIFNNFGCAIIIPILSKCFPINDADISKDTLFNENEFLSSLAQKICSAAKTLPHEDCLSVLKIILDVKIYNHQLAADIYSNYAKKDLLPILETSDKPRVCTHLARSLYELGEEDSLIWGRLLKSMNDKITQFSSFELTEYFWVLAKTNPINEVFP